MFGYFKLDKECPNNIFTYYKKYYCLLCKALSKHYGIFSRFTLSYDVAFLFAMIDDENKTNHIGKIHCIKTDETIKKLLIDKTSKDIATVNILLSAAKLEDDILDEHKLSAKVVYFIMKSAIKKAKKQYPLMWKIISEEYENLRKFEKADTDIETLEYCFSRMMTRLVKECFNITDTNTITKLEIASRWLYFIDAVDDIDENLKDGVFNPLQQYNDFKNLKQYHYQYIIKHLYSIFDKASLTHTKKDMRNLMIDRVIFWGIPETTLRILTKTRY